MLYSEMTRGRQRRPAVFGSSMARSRRFQLVGAIIAAVLLPWFVAIALNPLDADLIRNTMLANGIAILCGYYMYQSVTIYPGVQASYFILPAF